MGHESPQTLLGIYTHISVKSKLDYEADHPEEAAYSMEERDQMDDLVGFAIGQYSEVKTYRSLKQRQAEAYATVYGLTPENMDADIFGGDQ